jgi:hypothetical protein
MLFLRGAYCVGGPRAATIRIVKFPAIDAKVEAHRGSLIVCARHRAGDAVKGQNEA